MELGTPLGTIFQFYLALLKKEGEGLNHVLINCCKFEKAFWYRIDRKTLLKGGSAKILGYI